MALPEITTKLLAAKKTKGLTFAELGKGVGRDEVWIAAVFYRQASASPEEASQLGAALGLGLEVAHALTEYPLKGLGPVVPTDPLIYRFYEIMQVYGMPLKAVIHEKFGDGIMSAIDFTVTVDKEEDPKGERVKITMSGKFLPYNKVVSPVLLGKCLTLLGEMRSTEVQWQLATSDGGFYAYRADRARVGTDRVTGPGSRGVGQRLRLRSGTR